MFIIVLVIAGLICGSFANALVWRIHEQAKTKKTSKELSILSGRSMCPHCKHQLQWIDLIPVISWVTLKGRCRYCNKAISWQYPLVELVTALLFTVSFVLWPHAISGMEIMYFAIWCMLLTGFVALSVYDLRWYILPNRIIYSLLVLAFVELILQLSIGTSATSLALNSVVGVLIGGGIFYILFVVSKGEWIGGGDVRLGGLLGLIIGGPFSAMLMLIMASGIGTIISLPFVIAGKAGRTTRIPFGPLLIVGAIIAELFTASIRHWAVHLLS